MKHLVTGGTGFTGKALVTRLVKEGHRVIALDYKEGLKTQEIRELGAEVMIGSVTDRKAVERCMKGVDVVHHLAAAFREMNVPEKHYWEVNVQGTRNDSNGNRDRVVLSDGCVLDARNEAHERVLVIGDVPKA